ncbi:hypothetical protein BAU15_11810 [Enterococcus sp. JM4C]|uniref:hypothetical protein n=1 Tax=Candidatus Enterococcus huntleyi TaxID=1857217 RepID=UPI00137A8573|nr:hypothetical protein [Enterococcus sp. JM4C]KAF1298437.1 hypothetical protein BAU15_11810 [Enterococcus sp. JM4C]
MFTDLQRLDEVVFSYFQSTYQNTQQIASSKACLQHLSGFDHHVDVKKQIIQSNQKKWVAFDNNQSQEPIYKPSVKH